MSKFKEDYDINYKNIKLNKIFLLVNDVCNTNCDYCIFTNNHFLSTGEIDLYHIFMERLFIII